MRSRWAGAYRLVRGSDNAQVNKHQMASCKCHGDVSRCSEQEHAEGYVAPLSRMIGKAAPRT